MNADQYSLAKSILRKYVRFGHEKNGGPVHIVVAASMDGMVELNDMGGWFAPHLFVIADDIGGIPPNPSAAVLDDPQKIIESLRDALRWCARNDATPIYRHHAMRAYDMKTPAETGATGTRWLTPREIARAELKEPNLATAAEALGE